VQLPEMLVDLAEFDQGLSPVGSFGGVAHK